MHPPDQLEVLVLDGFEDLPLQPARSRVSLRRVVLEIQDVVPAVCGDGAAEGRDIPVVETGETVNGLLHQIPLGRMSEDVQPVLDQIALDLDDVIVQVVDGIREDLVRTRRIDLHVAVEVHPPHDIPYPREIQRPGLGLTPGAGVHVLLNGGLQLAYLVVPASTSHYRYHVVDDDRRSTPLGLDPFAGVAYDVRIDVRDRILDGIGAAVTGEGDGLPRQPFQGAVSPHVYHRLRSEDVPEPAVVCEVLMGHHRQRVVVALLYVPAAVGLESHEDIPENRSWDRDPPVHGVEVAGRPPPSVLHPRFGGIGQRPIPLIVLLRTNQVQGPPADLLVGYPIEIVGQSRQEGVHQLPRGLGDRIPDIIPVVPHPVQYVDDAGERIETGGSAGVRRLGRIHVQEYGDLPIRVGCVAEHRPHHRDIRDAVVPVVNRHVHAGAVLQLLRGARWDGDYLPVELGMGDVEGHLRRRQAVDVRLPRLVIGGGRHRLYHGDAVGCEEVVIADLLPIAGCGDQGLREAHGLDASIEDRLPVHGQMLAEDAFDAYRSRERLLVCLEEHRHGIPSAPLHCADEPVDVSDVACEPLLLIEEDPDIGFGRIQPLEVGLEAYVLPSGIVYPLRRGPRRLRHVDFETIEPADGP